MKKNGFTLVEHEYSSMRRNEGFTLVELLVVIAIISLMSIFTLTNFRLGEGRFATESAAHKLAQDLRRVQGMAMSAKEFHEVIPEGGYGIYFKELAVDSYILFADCNNNKEYDSSGTPCNGFSEKVEEMFFGSKVVAALLYSDSQIKQPLNIVFTPPEPIINITSGGSLAEIVLTGPQTKTVSVNKAGLIAIE